MSVDPTNYNQYTSPVQQSNYKVNAVHDTDEYILRTRLGEKTNEYEIVIPGSVAPPCYHVKIGDQCWESLARRPQTGSGKVRVWTSFNGYVMKKSILLKFGTKYSPKWCELVFKQMSSEVRFVGFAATKSDLKDGSVYVAEQPPTVWCGGQAQITNNSPVTIMRGTIIRCRVPRVLDTGKPENYTDGKEGGVHQQGIPYKKVTGIIEPVIPEHFISRKNMLQLIKGLLNLDAAEKTKLTTFLHSPATEYGTDRTNRVFLMNLPKLRELLLEYGNSHISMLNDQVARAQDTARRGELLTIQILQVQI